LRPLAVVMAAPRRFVLEDPPADAAVDAPIEAFTLHLCIICGTFWKLWTETPSVRASWSLHVPGARAGACCDNRPMAEQIVRVYFDPVDAWIPMLRDRIVQPGATRSGANLAAVDGVLKAAYEKVFLEELKRPPAGDTLTLKMLRDAADQLVRPYASFVPYQAPPPDLTRSSSPAFRSRPFPEYEWVPDPLDGPPPSLVVAEPVMTPEELAEAYRKETGTSLTPDEVVLVASRFSGDPSPGGPLARLMRGLRRYAGSRNITAPLVKAFEQEAFPRLSPVTGDRREP
jgi:hypothetical protein